MTQPITTSKLSDSIMKLMRDMSVSAADIALHLKWHVPPGSALQRLTQEFRSGNIEVLTAILRVLRRGVSFNLHPLDTTADPLSLDCPRCSARIHETCRPCARHRRQPERRVRVRPHRERIDRAHGASLRGGGPR